jgi:mono/diheme cytochrome c family protein
MNTVLKVKVMPRKTGRGTSTRYVLVSVLTLVACIASSAQGQALDDTSSPGKRLAIAADCVACHTAPGGQPFAGGYPLSSPMGVSAAIPLSNSLVR